MGQVIATGVFGAVAIALAAEIINIATTFSALQHAASYNAWLF